jgi:hypothetical protein
MMMVEMNLGVVCGCLFSVEPILAVIFPRLPPRFRRQTSGYPESFGVYALSDVSDKPRDKPIREENTFEAHWTTGGTGSNFTNAVSSGRKRDARFSPGVITVNREFTVEEETTPCHSPVSECDVRLHFITDAGVGNWAMDDVCLKE